MAISKKWRNYIKFLISQTGGRVDELSEIIGFNIKEGLSAIETKHTKYATEMLKQEMIWIERGTPKESLRSEECQLDWMELEDGLPSGDCVDIKYLDGSTDWSVHPLSVEWMEIEFWRPSSSKLLPSPRFEIETYYGTTMQVNSDEELLQWAGKRFKGRPNQLKKIEAFLEDDNIVDIEVSGYTIKRGIKGKIL